MVLTNVGDIYISNKGDKCKVITYINASKVEVLFDDKHHTICFFTSSSLRKGKFRNPNRPVHYNVGYVGQGIHSPSVNGKHTSIYRAWCNLLQRVYSSTFHKRQPSYKLTTVCEEWHNFQNFADWYTNQPFKGKGYDLDKDLKVRDNLHYSPSHCLLLPRELNTVLIDNKSARTSLPIGVRKCKDSKSFTSFISKNSTSKYLGSFPTAHEAHQAYREAKETYVHELANTYVNQLDPIAYTHLVNWEVDTKYRLVER